MRLRTQFVLSGLACLAVSWFLWGGMARFTKGVIADPSPPTSRERLFEFHIDPKVSALLNKRLRSPLVYHAGLADVIDAFRDEQNASIYVNWVALERMGIGRDYLISVDLSGLTLADALVTVISQPWIPHDALSCVIDDGVIIISTRSDLAADHLTQVYDVRDLLGNSKTSTTAALEKRITETIDPQSWDTGTRRIHSLSGQLIITQTRVNQIDTIRFLNRLRVQRAVASLGMKAAILLACVFFCIALTHLFVHRLSRGARRRSAGLCIGCGYNLCASTGVCPECGAAISDGRIR